MLNYFFNFNPFHVYGLSNTSIGNNSKRPASISNIKTNFENTENIPKFPVGPTNSSPGPILFNVATTAVKFVIKSKLSKAIAAVDNTNKRQYVIK